MSICWYCHWGWPQVVVHIYHKYLLLVGELALDYGPAHVVWSDENFEADTIQWCIDHAQECRGELSDSDLALVIESLEELLAVPKEIRECEPPDYDGQNPENFPPGDFVMMARKRVGAGGY